MNELTLQDLAKRVEALERKLAEREPGSPDWRRSVGMFDDDPEFIRQVVAEASAQREDERAAAREATGQ